jgi:hypothetical protein
MSTSYILAPEYWYLRRMGQSWSMSDLPAGPVASTFEGGGETAYSGITLTLETQMVPEPATFALLAWARWLAARGGRTGRRPTEEGDSR